MAGILRTKGKDDEMEIIAPTEEEAKQVYSLLLPLNRQRELDEVWPYVRKHWRKPTIADQRGGNDNGLCRGLREVR